MHVRDVAAANIAAYESPVHGVRLNVGSGVCISVKELADMVSPNQEQGPRRQADAEVTLADLSRIRQTIGWQPKVSFAEGLADLRAALVK